MLQKICVPVTSGCDHLAQKKSQICAQNIACIISASEDRHSFQRPLCQSNERKECKNPFSIHKTSQSIGYTIRHSPYSRWRPAVWGVAKKSNPTLSKPVFSDAAKLDVLIYCINHCFSRPLRANAPRGTGKWVAGIAGSHTITAAKHAAPSILFTRSH